MTDTTETVDQADEPKTESIPGRSRGIVLANGTLLDPVFASVKSLVRAGDDDYRAVIAWPEGERAEKANVQAEREAQQAESAARIRADVAARHEARERLFQAKPWLRDQP